MRHDDNLTLPEPARALWLATREPIRRALAQLDPNREGCGSSSLAAQSVSSAAARQEAIGSVKAW